ncbi:acyl-CoA dehydrogenase domain protein [Parafrankia sp. EAN1pec]|uniref:acyl-CoA dehydrogenase family protein n=1 Tax=Parafrankia sp. (strain EAN1pec) TaxID=298653 RepID=UPI000054445E|nr:acyl-CoA dehydrogenase domain protein [Frankia sp. EAN1pec]
MNLDFTVDQQALRDAVRDFFDKESPTAVVREAEPLGFDAALWRKSAELGLAAIAVPEERGGGGAGLVELAIAAESVGQSLAPVPLIEAAATNRLLASLTDDSVVAPFVAGEKLATLALHPVIGDVARLVPAGAVADLVVVLRNDQLLLVRRPGNEPVAAVPNLGSMPLADWPVPADAGVLAAGPEAVTAHRRAVAHWQALTGVALVGLASRALDIGLDYVKQRRAFGVLIGSFQTIQHRLVDNATAVEGARTLAYEAAWAQDVDLAEAQTLAAASFLFASAAAFKTASESLHFHGGYGYTLEYDIQLYFRRAKAWPLVAGDRAAAYADLARRLYDAKEG